MQCKIISIFHPTLQWLPLDWYFAFPVLYLVFPRGFKINPVLQTNHYPLTGILYFVFQKDQCLFMGAVWGSKLDASSWPIIILWLVFGISYSVFSIIRSIFWGYFVFHISERAGSSQGSKLATSSWPLIILWCGHSGGELLHLQLFAT